MDIEGRRVDVSVLVPVRNERGNIGPLLAEIEAGLQGVGSFEVIYIDDGSTDGTAGELARLAENRPWLRVFSHETSCGQSCAVRTGARLARGSVLVTMDGDGQNDPAYIPALVAPLGPGDDDIGLVAGQRLGRKDTGFKRWQSRTANAVRSRVLKDGTRDTGCGLKAIRRDVYLALPYFDALHRFMPALVKREGHGIAYVDVVDRPRLTGQSNYGFLDRLWVGVLDLYGVWWLIRRRRNVPVIREIAKDAR